MAFTGVPMMVGGGEAQHSADLTRKLVANFFYGIEGVIRSADLRVLPQPAPSSAVRVSPGGVAVTNRAVGADREAYFDHNDADIVVPIEATGSSGPRTDLIVARVEDPFSAGSQWQYPSDRLLGPYIFVRVIPNVASNVFDVHKLGLGYSAVTLARVTQPANNTAVTQAMITDLRSMANGPQRYETPDAFTPTSVDLPLWTESRIQNVTQTLNYTDRAFVPWPSGASWKVPIPRWATGVDIFSVTQNPRQENGNVYGECAVGIDSWFGPAQSFAADSISSSVPNRVPIFYSNTMAWSPTGSYPGSVRTFSWRARMYDNAATRGRLVATTDCRTYISLNFKRDPIINYEDQ